MARGGKRAGAGRKKGIPNRAIDTRTATKRDAKAKAVEALAITETATLEELARIGFSNMLDYVRIGDDGMPHCNFAAMTRAQAAAIGELTVETREIAKGVDVDGSETAVLQRKVKFKLAPKTPALQLIGQYFGLFKDAPGAAKASKDNPLNADNSEKTPIEVARRIAFLLASAARAKRPAAESGAEAPKTEP